MLGHFVWFSRTCVYRSSTPTYMLSIPLFFGLQRYLEAHIFSYPEAHFWGTMCGQFVLRDRTETRVTKVVFSFTRAYWGFFWWWRWWGWCFWLYPWWWDDRYLVIHPLSLMTKRGSSFGYERVVMLMGGELA